METTNKAAARLHQASLSHLSSTLIGCETQAACKVDSMRHHAEPLHISSSQRAPRWQLVRVRMKTATKLSLVTVQLQHPTAMPCVKLKPARHAAVMNIVPLSRRTKHTPAQSFCATAAHTHADACQHTVVFACVQPYLNQWLLCNTTCCLLMCLFC